MAEAENWDSGTSFLEKKVAIDFCDPNILHDRVLIVQDKKFYVNSNHLSLFSEYFCGLFNSNFQEKEQKEIELKDIKAEEFEIYLKMLYPFDVQVTKDNLSALLVLSNMFLTPFIWQKCIKFLENPVNLQTFELDQMLDWMTISGSETFKKRMENHCAYLYNYAEKELAKFYNIAVDFGFVNLIEHLIKKVCMSQAVGISLQPRMVKTILENDCTKFEEFPVFNLQSSRDDTIKTLYTFIRLLKYDIPDFEGWFVDNFGRLFGNPLSVDNVLTLTDMLHNLSPVHKRKLVNILLKSAEKLKTNRPYGTYKTGLRNFLPAFAFLLYEDDPQTVIPQSYLTLNEFNYDLLLTDVQKALDNNLARTFSKTNNFGLLEIVLQNNLIRTKNVMVNYLRNNNVNTLITKMELVKRSPEVAAFLRKSIPKKKTRDAVMKSIFR